MLHLKIFTDGSLNTQLKTGYGAYLIVSDSNKPIDLLKSNVKIKRFEQTSSTKLELQTLLWALKETISSTKESDITLTIYTDCQNIIDLPSRRARLEQKKYLSGKGKLLSNHELYKEFYDLLSNIKFGLCKVIGHQPSNKKDELDQLFSLVDQASRRALRNNH